MTKLKVGSFFTYSGTQFDALSPKAKDVHLVDIAHALSNICRFNGHTTEFYSVAQHSVYVMKCCSYDNKLHALLHNASEAYLSDIISPLKKTEEFNFYREIEDNLMDTIYKKFGLQKKNASRS